MKRTFFIQGCYLGFGCEKGSVPPKRWTGLHGYHQLVMGKKVSGPWIDRTAYYHSLQRREGKLISEFTTEHHID